jgi:hypothetical protein
MLPPLKQEWPFLKPSQVLKVSEKSANIFVILHILILKIHNYFCRGLIHQAHIRDCFTSLAMTMNLVMPVNLIITINKVACLLFFGIL